MRKLLFLAVLVLGISCQQQFEEPTPDVFTLEGKSYDFDRLEQTISEGSTTVSYPEYTITFQADNMLFEHDTDEALSGLYVYTFSEGNIRFDDPASGDYYEGHIVIEDVPGNWSEPNIELHTENGSLIFYLTALN
jgi:hypothetical protein